MRILFAVTFMIGLWVITAMQSHRGDWLTIGTPPETPDATVAELNACLRRPEQERMVCEANVKGMTAFEFVAMLAGCPSILDDNKSTLCERSVERLRPQFVNGKTPPAFAPLSAAELASIQIGCHNTREMSQRALCSSGMKKLRDYLSEH